MKSCTCLREEEPQNYELLQCSAVLDRDKTASHKENSEGLCMLDSEKIDLLESEACFEKKL